MMTLLEIPASEAIVEIRLRLKAYVGLYSTSIELDLLLKYDKTNWPWLRKLSWFSVLTKVTG